MHRRHKHILAFGPHVLEQPGLGELGAAVGRGARGGDTRRGQRDHVGVDAQDGGVRVAGGEERAGRDHGAFDVGLVSVRGKRWVFQNWDVFFRITSEQKR